MPQIKKLARPVPLREQVVESVMQAIQSGRFQPGERLTEIHVGEVLGVSRTPVREALGMLAQRGILTRREGRGFIVTSPQKKALARIFDLRRLLEPYAVKMAAELASPEQLKELKAAVQTLCKTAIAGDAESVMQANRELRALLFSIADNEPLSNAIALLNDHVHFIGTITLENRSVRNIMVANHQRIFRAIHSGSGPAAEQAMRDYLDAAYQAFAAALAAKQDAGTSEDTAANPEPRVIKRRRT